MIFAILPVKPPGQAKQRLSSLLGPQEREALAWGMYEEVLSALCATRGLDRIVVATLDPAVAEHARRSGVLVLNEEEQLGHSNVADAAARRAKEMGARTVILVPIDVPLVTSAELEQLIAAIRPGLLIVPSADGTGTNVLVCTPPDVIETCFGENSFRQHVERARARGVEVDVMRLPGLMLDIDTREDLAELVARAPHCRAAELVRHRCLSAS